MLRGIRKPTAVSRLFGKSAANAMDRSLGIAPVGSDRTLLHMPIPIVEILNTEGLGARTLQLESLHF